MPKITDDVLNSVFFLYATREDALEGKNPGGSGFFLEIGQNIQTGGGHHVYGVTNWHVACRDGFSVIRVNAKNGGTDILEFGPEDWEFIPRGPDVAVVPIASELPFTITDQPNKIATVSIGSFAPRGQSWNSLDFSVSVGEDALMLGLFVDHHGRGTSIPSARFGNVSMLPHDEAPIEQPTGYSAASYVVDMHSRTGFSGSPVFVFRTFGSDLTRDQHMFDRITIDDTHGATMEVGTHFYFLGMLWGQFPERWELRNKSDMAEGRQRHLVTSGAYVDGMSGMTCVVPSWDTEKVLKLPRLQKLRDTA